MAGTQNHIGLQASYGYIWMNTGNFTGVSFNFTTSYQELTSLGTNFTLATNSANFAMTTDGRLKYTGLTDKLFSIDAQYSYNIGTIRFAMKLYKNGIAIPDSEIYSGNFRRCILCGFPVELSENDYLSIYAKSESNVSGPILQVNLCANFVGGM